MNQLPSPVVATTSAVDEVLAGQVERLQRLTAEVRELGRLQTERAAERADLLLAVWENHGLTYAELAQLLGVSTVTIHNQLSAARRRRGL